MTKERPNIPDAEKKRQYCNEVLKIRCETCGDYSKHCPNHPKHKEYLKTKEGEKI